MKKHGQKIPDTKPNLETSKKDHEEDFKFNYHRAKLTFGLLLNSKTQSGREMVNVCTVSTNYYFLFTRPQATTSMPIVYYST